VRNRFGSPRATGPQVAFLKRLLAEAFAKRINVGFSSLNWERLTLREASALISDIRARLGREEVLRG
jgi:hypothetical protein